MKHNNVAFIPLRGGSKSIPLKNIKMINGRPLVYWVLDAAVKCKYIDKIFISTDSEQIKKTVQNYGLQKVVVVGRSENTARDDSTTESAMLEFAREYDFRNIVLIQATSPLLESEDLNRGFEKLMGSKYDSILSAVRQKRFIWRQEDSICYPQNYDYKNRPMRQQFEGFLVENGAFYITNKEALLRSKCRISGNIEIIEMKEESYFEIDEPSDWIIVENLLKKKYNGTNNDLEETLKNIKLLITDSDGVLTDGGMYYSEHGDELKKFNTKDGMGVQMLRNIGVKTIIMTGEDVELVRRRATKLKIDEIHMGIKDKGPLVKELAAKHGCQLSEIAYIGDDINDLEPIKIVGFGCSVSDGMEAVKESSKYVTKSKGGQGALREVAELIIKHKK